MSYLNDITSVLAFIAAVPILYAYLRILPNASEIVRNMSVSIVSIASAFAWRSLFWDNLPTVMGEDWSPFYERIGGATINAGWNVLFVYGCWCGLKALYLMVPEEDRAANPIWRAWLYPPRKRRRIMRR